jgi:hypothetical protein
MQRLDREVFASSDHEPVLLPKPTAKAEPRVGAKA